MGDYLVFHDVAWHGVYSLYFFVIGMSAALFFFSALSWFRAEFATLRRSAFYAAFALLVVAGLLLIADLSQPLRFLYVLNPLYWNMTSPLVWGTILIALYGLTLLWYYVALGKDDVKAAKQVAVIGSVLALGLTVYTGFDLAVHQHRPVWNTPLLPVLFVALSLISGAAVASFLDRANEPLRNSLRQVMLWGGGATLVMILSLVVTTAYGGSADELAYVMLTSGSLGTIFVGVGIVLGAAVPIGLLLAPIGRAQTGVMVASLLLLAGGLALRYSILTAPQLVHTFFS
jgi:formate-dependent nitrite reductase membrane component NrfD